MRWHLRWSGPCTTPPTRASATRITGRAREHHDVALQSRAWRTTRGACDRGGHDLPYRARRLGRGVQDVHPAEGRGGTARVKERWRLWERPDACEHR